MHFGAALLIAGSAAWWATRPPLVPAVAATVAPLVRTLQFSARVATASRVELGSTLTGRVLSVDSRVDSATRAVTVRAVVPNQDAALKPGMAVRVTPAGGAASAGCEGRGVAPTRMMPTPVHSCLFAVQCSEAGDPDAGGSNANTGHFEFAAHVGHVQPSLAGEGLADDVRRRAGAGEPCRAHHACEPGAPGLRADGRRAGAPHRLDQPPRRAARLGCALRGCAGSRSRRSGAA